MENRLPQCFQLPDTKPPSWSRQQHSKQNRIKTNILLHSSEIAVHQGKCLKCPLETDGSCLQHLQFAQLEQI